VIVAVGSWRGFGATTAAVLLAAVLAGDDGESWLIEADPAGGVLGARIALDPDQAWGLERVAFPASRASVPAAVESAAVGLGRVRLLPAPGDPFRAWACHTPRSPWVPSLPELAGDVVVDVGRLRAGSPAASILGRADVVLAVTDAETVSLVATQRWAESSGRTSPSEPALALDTVRVAVVDAPGSRERVDRVVAEAVLGDRFAGWLPWSPAAVADVLRGVPLGDRRARRDPLVRAAHELAGRLRPVAPTEGLRG